MHFLIATDKFKNSLTSMEAAKAIEAGLREVLEDARIQILPMADGGDGFIEVLSYYVPGSLRLVPASDPLFRNIKAPVYFSSAGDVAMIEMAKVSGLMLLHPKEYNPLKTSTYGTGELIKESLKSRPARIILGIGGSATNDGGIGMAAALGVKFLDRNGKALLPIGENLLKIHSIDTSGLEESEGTSFEIACDVDNPLTGPRGATKIYSPQKGATSDHMLLLEEGMLHYSELLKKELSANIGSLPGAGAAGGLASACLAFLDAKLRSGIELVLELSKAEELIAKAGFILTGEGKLDHQSLSGKVISGLIPLCAKHKKPLVVFCGRLEVDSKELKNKGIDAAIQISPDDLNDEKALKEASHLLKKAVVTWLQSYAM